MLGRGFQCERHRVIDAILNASGALRDAQTLLAKRVDELQHSISDLEQAER